MQRLSRTRTSRCVHPLDEKIEEKKKDAEKKQDESRINLPAREAGQRTKKLGRNGLEARLFAETVKRADDGIAGKAAAKGAEFVLGPHGKIVTLAPNEGRADSEHEVTKKS